MNLIILGASTRAAAFSAHRAGLRPWCVDLFADADLAQRFPVRRIGLGDYPHGLLAALAEAPDGPVLYTGGLENYPELIARIDRPIWGNTPEVLRYVRSPFRLVQTLRGFGWDTPDVRRDPPPPTDTRRWLLKPLRGSGGVGIRRFDGRSFDPESYHLQELIVGDMLGVVYVGVPDGGAIMVGQNRALAGDWLHAPPYHYSGSIAVWNCLLESMLEALGDLLVQEFQLTGLFGVDLVVRTNSRSGVLDVVPLEVNPRYTASVEVLERAWGRSLLDLHRTVFEQGAVNWNAPATRWPEVPGKAVLYAKKKLVFPADGPWRHALHESADAVQYADIPHANEVIAAGRPVLTLFASGATGGQCEDELERKAQALDRCLWG